MNYQITDGTVSLGGHLILSHIDFSIKGNERIAIVGKNGCGKTTLLRLLAGELELDRDDHRQTPGIWTSRRISIAYLPQTLPPEQTLQTVEEVLQEAYTGSEEQNLLQASFALECDKLFTAFGFSQRDKKRKLSSFSGGEQTRIRLIGALLQRPELLLLDEPTNHLDLSAAEWLETYLQNWPGALVLVSHDRFFLDQVTEVIYELQDGKLKRYPGNYTQYRIQKKKDLAVRKKQYEQQQEEIRRLEELIRRFKNKPRKAAFARSRKKLLERMEELSPPKEEEIPRFEGTMDPEIPGNKWMLETEHLKIGYDKVLAEITLRVRRGQKIAIIGDNGAGKTTFLKTIAGFMRPLEGKCLLGSRAIWGYFDQHTAEFSSEATVLEQFQLQFPGRTEKEARQYLARFQFPGKEAGKPVSRLSGGEKSRLYLAILLAACPNLLLLDEPTNHMDLTAMEILEAALKAYTGTLLFISHDRYFISQTADAILLLEDGKVMYYPFGYEHYLSHKGKGGDTAPAALVRAEDAALVAGLRAVPEAEKYQLREISTENAWADWQFRLKKEALLEAEEAMAALQTIIRQEEEEAWKHYAEGTIPDAEQTFPEQRLLRKEQKERLLDTWTQACLDWYELYLEVEADRTIHS